MRIINGTVIFRNRVEKADISINKGYITPIGQTDEPEIDAAGFYVCPGFIDIHTHGGYGGDFMDASTDAFDKVLRFHLENGTTSVLATTVTAPISSICRFLGFYREYVKNSDRFARLLGVHLEGPYLSKRNRGAQKEEYLRIPEQDDYSFILDNADIVRSVTIAPELPGAPKMAEELSQKGILVCGGHDDGVYPEFLPTLRNGLSHLTHVYCAMSELRFRNSERNVGLREYGMTDDTLTCEMIADNKHIPPQLAKMIVRCKGVGRTCVVSDSLRCAGMPPDGKTYLLGAEDDPQSQRVILSDGVALLADGSRYAGSITPVRAMVRNLIEAGIPISDAVQMGTLTPAKILGEGDLGEIALGRRADLCLLDKEFNTVMVLKEGEIVWKRR